MFRRKPACTLIKIACSATFLLSAASAHAQPTTGPSRGQLLYTTHCVACHDTQKHWRDNRAVRDWDGLIRQVRRWQDVQLLQWTDADILDVARHLNDRIYKLPEPSSRQGQRLSPEAARG